MLSPPFFLSLCSPGGAIPSNEIGTAEFFIKPEIKERPGG